MARLYVFVLLMLCLIQPALADTSLGDLVSAHRAAPKSEEATGRLEASVSAGLPTELRAEWLDTLPVDSTSLSYDLGTLIVPRAYLPTHAEEPQHQWKFSKVVYVYQPLGETLTRLCAVHYNGEANQALAVRVARLLSLAHQTLITKTGHETANGTAPYDVWLCAGGQNGGEQWRSNLYLYTIDTPRSSIEWIREIVHEYSHLALPAVGGYTAPEYWANGYLGERLIVRWFIRDPEGPKKVEYAWGDFSGAPNFTRLLLTPALALYKKIGPNPKWLARKDEMGMRYFIGQALTFDDKYGAKRLGDALARLPHFRTATATDFAAALTETLSASNTIP